MMMDVKLEIYSTKICCAHQCKLTFAFIKTTFFVIYIPLHVIFLLWQVVSSHKYLSPNKRMPFAYRHQSELDCLLVLIRATDSHFHLLDTALLLYYR